MIKTSRAIRLLIGSAVLAPAELSASNAGGCDAEAGRPHPVPDGLLAQRIEQRKPTSRARRTRGDLGGARLYTVYL